jgi:hypothetical protein
MDEVNASPAAFAARRFASVGRFGDHGHVALDRRDLEVPVALDVRPADVGLGHRRRRLPAADLVRPGEQVEVGDAQDIGDDTDLPRSYVRVAGLDSGQAALRDTGRVGQLGLGQLRGVAKPKNSRAAPALGAPATP